MKNCPHFAARIPSYPCKSKIEPEVPLTTSALTKVVVQPDPEPLTTPDQHLAHSRGRLDRRADRSPGYAVGSAST